MTDRRRALAREAARKNHCSSVVLDGRRRVVALDGHVWVGGGEQYYGFSTCPHPDCRLAREPVAVSSVRKAAEELIEQFQRMKTRQHELLVHGQTLESASKNWDEHPEAFAENCIDFQPLIDALGSSDTSTPDLSGLTALRDEWREEQRKNEEQARVANRHAGLQDKVGIERRHVAVADAFKRCADQLDAVLGTLGATTGPSAVTCPTCETRMAILNGYAECRNADCRDVGIQKMWTDDQRLVPRAIDAVHHRRA